MIKVGKQKEKVWIKRDIRGTSKFAAYNKFVQFEVCGVLQLYSVLNFAHTIMATFETILYSKLTEFWFLQRPWQNLLRKNTHKI